MASLAALTARASGMVGSISSSRRMRSTLSARLRGRCCCGGGGCGCCGCCCCGGAPLVDPQGSWGPPSS
eukprot:scaffold61351_cov27-Phaeocystis_antarctica.AAC.1